MCRTVKQSRRRYVVQALFYTLALLVLTAGEAVMGACGRPQSMGMAIGVDCLIFMLGLAFALAAINHAEVVVPRRCPECGQLPQRS